MKKTLLLASLGLAISSQAQTLTATFHAPSVGNTYSTYQCDSTGVTPGNAGANAIWNFTALTPRSSSQKNFVFAVNTNTAYNPATIFSDDGSSETGYFQATVNDTKYFGGDFTANGPTGPISVNTKFSSPAIIGKYPMSLNTATSSLVSGTITIGAFGSGPFTGTCSLVADGAGTLNLASKTFTDVVRLITTQELNATLSLGSGTVTLQNHIYYSASVGNKPLLTITSSTVVTGFGSNKQIIVTILKDYDVVSVDERQKEQIVLSVFPNPSSSVVNFSTKSTEATKVIAYDVVGKLVATEILNDGKATLNVSNFVNGIYMYSVIGKNNQVVTTGKFNVEK